jgi:drug/metabolite transporter (DMT)-like permease
MSRSPPNKPHESAPRRCNSLTAFLSSVWKSPYILLTLAVFFWSGNFIVGRAVTGIVPPIALAFWRWTIALLLVLCFGMLELRHNAAALVASWRMLLVLAALGIAAFNTLVYVGLQKTTAVNALLLQSTMPIVILAATLVLYGERPGVRQAVGVVISLAGVAVIASKGNWGTLTALTFNIGDLWVLAAVGAYAVYSALLRTRPAVHPLSFLRSAGWHHDWRSTM